MMRGTTYCRICTATWPAGSLRTLEKWSLESMECVGSVEVGLFQTSNWCLAEDSRTAEDPVFNCADAVLMMGRTKGARSESTKRVTRSVIVSISFSSPGILETISEMLRTTLSLKTRMG